MGLVSRESVPNLGRLGQPRYRVEARREAAATYPRPLRLKRDALRNQQATGSDRPMKAMHSILTIVQVQPAMNLRQALLHCPGSRITTQLLLWFLIISLIPCVVLTAIISYQCQPIPEEDGAPGTAGDLRRQGNPARDLHSRAPGRPEHGRAGITAHCRLDAAAEQRSGGRSRSIHPPIVELARKFRPYHGEFRRIVRLFQRLPVRHGWDAAVPAQARPGPRFEPPDRSAQGERAGRGVRPGSHAVANRGLGLPDVPGPKRTGGVHRQPGLQRPGADHRVRGPGAGQRAGLPRLQGLQRAGRDRRGDGGDAPRRGRVHLRRSAAK